MSIIKGEKVKNKFELQNCSYKLQLDSGVLQGLLNFEKY